jgi:hypothetical protein
MSTILIPGQYQLDSNAPFGSYADYVQIEDVSVDPGSAITQNTPLVGEDGLQFGIDTHTGLLVTFTGHVWSAGGTPLQAMDAWNAWSGQWNDYAVRLQNNVMSQLRCYHPMSNVIRNLYGRPQQCNAVLAEASQGYIAFTASFQAADPNFYSDTLSQLSINQLPADTGGFISPFTPPLMVASNTTTQNTLALNTGSLPTWPIIQFIGPVAYPALSYVNTPVNIGYNGIIGAGQILTIDTRPWARTALLNGLSVAGNLTGDRMVNMRLFTGGTVFSYSGQDPYGESSCVVTWQNANAHIGGSA